MHMYTMHLPFNKSRILILPHPSGGTLNGRRPRQRPVRPPCPRQTTAPKKEEERRRRGGRAASRKKPVAMAAGLEKVIKRRRGRGKRERGEGKKTEGGEHKP